jgi:hypothetical protein
MRPQTKLLRRTGISSFVLGAASSVFASYYYKALDTKDYKIILILSLAVATASLLYFSLATTVTLLRQTQSSENTSRIALRHGADRLDFDAVIQKAQQRFAFMGVIAKRSVNSDKFKALLSERRDTSFELRFLLLDPRSAVFRQRAADENESAEAWLSDLQSTVTRLTHYASKYNIVIRIRLYGAYPIWRLMIADESVVVANTFQMGKRATESSQIVADTSTDEVARALTKLFQTTWDYSSREISGEADVI